MTMQDKSQKLIKQLADRRMTLAVAESCTGGAFMAALVRVPGASEALRGGVVTYNDDAKVELVGIKRETIDGFGVVSVEVAKEMASGVRAKLCADIGVGVTGYAGPGGTDVGEVCFGIVFEDEEFTFAKKFTGMTRGEVIDASVDFLVRLLYEKV